MVPNGWDVKTLNEVSKITRLAGAEYSDVWETNPHGEIIALRGYNIGNNHINLRDVERITQEMSLKLSRSKLFKDDIVFPCVGSIGKAYLVKEDNRFHINQNIAKLTPDETVDPLYLTYCLLSKDSENQIMKFNTSSSQPNVLVGNLRKFEFQFPKSVSEQQKIAKILSTWDKAISTTERLIDNSTQQKKALMQQLLTGKKRLLNESGKQFKGEWEETALIDTADSKKYSFTGGPFGSDLKSSDYSTTGVRIIQLQNIGDGCFNNGYKIYTTEEKADQLISCNIYPNEIIISKMGDPVARATLIPDFHSRYLMASDGIRLAVNKSKYDTNFVLETINSSAFRGIALSKSTGSTRRRIGLTDLKNITFNCPALPEQQKIATVLTNADKEIELLEQQLADLQQEKKALMQVLLTGKKRVKLND